MCSDCCLAPCSSVDHDVTVIAGGLVTEERFEVTRAVVPANGTIGWLAPQPDGAGSVAPIATGPDGGGLLAVHRAGQQGGSNEPAATPARDSVLPQTLA